MTESHNCRNVPSSLLCLVALGIVGRLRPGWLSIELGVAAGAEGVSAERLSRLVSGAIGLFEQVLATLTRRGRPPGARDERDSELELTRQMLAVASALLSHVSTGRDIVRDQIVGAWQRLSRFPSMTQARFCQTFRVSQRTLRNWLRKARRRSPLPLPPSQPPGPRPRPPRRRRFDFDVMLPDTQLGADTTDLSAFGVPLKLIAAQDIGGRDSSLFDAVIVDDHESAELVTQLLGDALRERPGAQAITDQGTPYMAALTAELLEQLGAEHAPQREGDPCGKATVERAFRTVKDILQPVLSITNRIADAIPAMRNKELAKAVVKVGTSVVLRAFQHGARAARAAIGARASLDAKQLAALAEQSRERARANDNSARLLLTDIHKLYGITRPLSSFIHLLRRYPLDVLHQAERMFQSQVHRADIHDRASYFCALVRIAHKDHVHARERDRQDRLADLDCERQERAHLATWTAWHADPARRLHDALDMIAMQWLPATAALLFDGSGAGLGHLQAALCRLLALHGPSATDDIARGVLHTWRLTALDRLGPNGTDAVCCVLIRELASATAGATHHFAPGATSASLPLAGHFRRPPPSDRLRN
jgi:DNA-directed RNA polymerase specialized sigma24 family protein